MARIQVSNDPSGRIIVSFPYDPLLVAKVKTIDGRRWHPEEKHWMEHFLESAPWTFPNKNGIFEEILKVFEGGEIHSDPDLKSATSKAHPAPMPAPLRKARPGIRCGVKDTPSPLEGEGRGEGYIFEDLRRELVSRKYSYTPHF